MFLKVSNTAKSELRFLLQNDAGYGGLLTFLDEAVRASDTEFAELSKKAIFKEEFIKDAVYRAGARDGLRWVLETIKELNKTKVA